MSNLDLSLPLLQVPMVFLDVETTGLYPWSGDRVCEIALLKLTGPEVQEFSSLVYPERPIPPDAMRIHRISDEMVRDAPRFRHLADKLESMLAGSLLVAHNAPFDLGFLEAELARLERRLPDLPVLDTLVLARRHLGLPRHSLEYLTRALEIPATGAHRALHDVRTTRHLLQHLLESLDESHRPLNLGELLALQ